MAALVLDCMMAARVDFAVLHGEQDVAAGVCTSDIDIVARDTPRRAMSKVHARLRDFDLHPVVIWPYDVGSASIFVVDGAAHDGVQLDMVHDRSGNGRYGVRAPAVLAEARLGHRWPKAASLDELLYLTAKRIRKRQHGRAATLRKQLDHWRSELVRRRAGELFNSEVAAAVHAFLDDAPAPSNPMRHLDRAVPSALRALARLRRPVGYWVAIRGEESPMVAEQIRRRFGRVLPHSAAGPTSGSWRESAAVMRAIAAVRWRAGVYSSWGSVAPGLRPDSVMHSSDDVDEIVRRIVLSMETRLHL